MMFVIKSALEMLVLTPGKVNHGEPSEGGHLDRGKEESDMKVLLPGK